MFHATILRHHKLSSWISVQSGYVRSVEYNSSIPQRKCSKKGTLGNNDNVSELKQLRLHVKLWKLTKTVTFKVNLQFESFFHGGQIIILKSKMTISPSLTTSDRSSRLGKITLNLETSPSIWKHRHQFGNIAINLKTSLSTWKHGY